jgi:hypothetical protein
MEMRLDHPAFDRAVELLAEKAKLIDVARKELAQLREAGKQRA